MPVEFRAGSYTDLGGPNYSSRSDSLRTLLTAAQAGIFEKHGSIPMQATVLHSCFNVTPDEAHEIAQQISHREPLTREQAEAVVDHWAASIGLTPRQRDDMVARLQKAG
jgi:hypothetical protein